MDNFIADIIWCVLIDFVLMFISRKAKKESFEEWKADRDEARRQELEDGMSKIRLEYMRSKESNSKGKPVENYR